MRTSNRVFALIPCSLAWPPKTLADRGGNGAQLRYIEAFNISSHVYFKDRSIAFSGDTAPFEAVAKMAKGADVLVHEAMYVPALETYIRSEIAKGRPVKFEDVMAHMNADHTPVEDVGRIAQEAGVKILVLSHLVPATDGITDDTWRAAAAKYFKGEIIVGEDLMV